MLPRGVLTGFSMISIGTRLPSHLRPLELPCRRHGSVAEPVGEIWPWLGLRALECLRHQNFRRLAH